MTLRYLKIFIDVYETQSTTKAAERLHIAQPSVSLAVKELESYYNVRLFDRISNRLHPTEAGTLFYNFAVNIVNDFSAMENALKDFSSIETLTIGASTNIGQLLLPGYIKTFQLLHSNIRVHSSVDTLNHITAAVRSQTVRLAFLEDKTDDTNLCFIPYIQDELVFIAASGHPLGLKKEVSAEELSEYDFVMRKDGIASRRIFSMSPFYHCRYSVIMESSSNDAIICAVKNGLGLSVMPYFQVKKDILSKELVRIHVKDFHYTKNFYLCFNRVCTLTRPYRQFIEAVCPKALNYL